MLFSDSTCRETPRMAQRASPALRPRLARTGLRPTSRPSSPWRLMIPTSSWSGTAWAARAGTGSLPCHFFAVSSRTAHITCFMRLLCRRQTGQGTGRRGGPPTNHLVLITNSSSSGFLGIVTPLLPLSLIRKSSRLVRESQRSLSIRRFQTVAEAKPPVWPW